MSDVPVIVNVRDRLTALRRLVDWLEQAGHQRIVLLDCASTYEPLLDYLKNSPHQWVRIDNLGSRALWELNRWDRKRLIGNDWFVYTDSDIVPLPDCPPNAIEHLQHLLLRYPHHRKAALGLHLDDVPSDMRSLDWELRLLYPEPGDNWKGMIEPGVFDSLSDTTFAVYMPNAGFTLEALRTGWPYQARHECVSWYGGEPSDEDRFYLARATAGPDGSSWKEHENHRALHQPAPGN